MKWIGLDVHKRVVQAAILHETGEFEEDIRFPCSPKELRAFCTKHVGRADKLALEATTNCWAVSAILREFSDHVMVSNPQRTKLIAQSRRKCDKVDALVLAQLLMAGFLPGVWEPDAKTRERRELSSRRSALVQDRTAIKNRLHAVLAQRLIALEVEDLFSKSGLEALRTLELDVHGRVLLDSDLRLLEQVEKEINALDEVLVRLAHEDEKARLLVTLPGFNFGGAVGVVAGTGDAKRFPDGDHFASYFGLVPSTKQSADTTYHGPITKQGRSHVRWIFCQAAQHIDRNQGPLGNFFRRVAKRKGRNKAVVATARKLAVIAWHMLVKNEPYRYADPLTTQTKLAGIRVRATGQRSRGGIPKGAPRPAAYGSGVGTKAIKAIDTVLAEEGLPPRSPAPEGERKFLEREGLTQAVAALNEPRRVPRKRGLRSKSANRVKAPGSPSEMASGQP